MKVFKLFTFLIVMLMLTSNVFSQGRPKANKDWDGTKPEALKGATSFVFIYAPFVSGSLGSAPAGSYSKFIDSTETQINNMAGFGFQYYISNKVSIVAGLRIGYNNSKNTDLSLNEITQSSAEWGFSG
ncbi:MAG: hypothetical protein IPJ45_02465 [Ignavibacteria bacterium]|nr:hypothetical protein [Ignavibacteria bacterium]